MFDERLGRALNFTEEDLAINRGGMMTEAQKQNLKQHLTLTLALLPVVLLGLGMVGVMGFAVLRGVGGGEFQVVGGLVVLVAIAGGAVGYSITLVQAWREGKIKTIEGYILFVKVPIGRGRWRYSIEVEDDQFQIDEKFIPFLQENEYYRFYFSFGSNKLLSVEWIDQ